MCDPVTLAIAATATSATSSIMQGFSQNAQAKALSQEATNKATEEKGAAAVRAERIRKIARSKAKEADAAFAAAGIDISSGAPLTVNQDILERGELDALTGINDSEGEANLLIAKARNIRARGRNAITGGLLEATDTALTNTAKFQNGWHGGIDNDD